MLSESDDDSEGGGGGGGGLAGKTEVDSGSESGSEFGPAGAEESSDSDEVRPA